MKNRGQPCAQSEARVKTIKAILFVPILLSVPSNVRAWQLYNSWGGARYHTDPACRAVIDEDIQIAVPVQCRDQSPDAARTRIKRYFTDFCWASDVVPAQNLAIMRDKGVPRSRATARMEKFYDAATGNVKECTMLKAISPISSGIDHQLAEKIVREVYGSSKTPAEIYEQRLNGCADLVHVIK
jgi:hypothetical protein